MNNSLVHQNPRGKMWEVATARLQKNLMHLGNCYSRLDDGEGIESTMVTNNAQYHQSCRLKYNNTMLKRAEKRALKLEQEELEVIPPGKRSRSRSADPSTFKSMCFFVKSLQVVLVSMGSSRC